MQQLRGYIEAKAIFATVMDVNASLCPPAASI